MEIDTLLACAMNDTFWGERKSTCGVLASGMSKHRQRAHGEVPIGILVTPVSFLWEPVVGTRFLGIFYQHVFDADG